MNTLRIELLKRSDGSVVLRCDRSDGTATWRRYEGVKAHYFALHDLTHYAVETVCGFRCGFYGLIAEGWNIGDFGTPWPRGPLPADAEPVELLVGCLSTEAASGERGTAEEFNAKTKEHHRTRGLPAPPTLDDQTLHAIREERRSLGARWIALPIGAGLELVFPAVAARS